MRYFSFLEAAPSKGVAMALPFDVSIQISPGIAGVLCGAFWALVAMHLLRAAQPQRTYLLLVSYAFGAVIANAYAMRFHNAAISPPLAWSIGLFAGAGIAAHLGAPVLVWLAKPHQVFRASGAVIMVGVPILLVPFIFVGKFVAAGVFVCGSALAGLWMLLFLVNAGLVSMTKMRRGATLAAAGFLVVPEFIAIVIAGLILDAQYQGNAPFQYLGF
jgi:hypothetical protein